MSMTQYQIEQMAGITTKEIAQHIMKKDTAAANNAMSLLVMQCRFYEPCGMALLQEAVKECIKEINNK